MPGRAAYVVSLALVETEARDRQRAESHGSLEWSPARGSPVRDWFRYRLCLGQMVRLPAQPKSAGALHTIARSEAGESSDGGLGGIFDDASKDNGNANTHEAGATFFSKVIVENEKARSTNEEPRCRALPHGTRTAMRALDFVDGPNSTGRFECGGLCTGDAHSRVLRPYRGPKDPDRTKQGMQHMLKPEGCRYHMFDEAALTRCLAGRSVLNIGGSVANSVQRGFERISNNSENKKQWWWSYGRTGINNNHDEATGKSTFGQSVITTQFIHHPFRYGLTNVLYPDAQKAVAFKSAAQYEKAMCSYDLVIFESGVHDLASPDRHVHRSMLAACTKPDAPCTDAELLPLLHNESWRLEMLGSYKRHLEGLMQMWDRCKAQRALKATASRKPLRPFQPIFKLSTAPNPAAEMKSCTAEWGYNTEGYYLLVANMAAREIVEGHGYEVFDPFPATQHADHRWFDLNGKDSLHSDVLSDLVTQMLINQLCD